LFLVYAFFFAPFVIPPEEVEATASPFLRVKGFLRVVMMRREAHD
jgi:hypothetical protein